MARKLCWGLVGWLLSSSYSYSEEIVFGQTPNAASAGYNWVMTNILPKVAGLQINGVFYRYTTIKNPEDDMLVHVQNKNVQGEGYIFRSTDDWSKLPGNTIQKTVPVPNIFGNLFGDGSIEVEGKGSVEDAFVVYTYQYDPCFDPQSSPVCPGYKIPVDYSVAVEDYDPLDDELIRKEFDRRVSIDDEDERERARARASAAAEKRQSRMEAALSAVNTALLTAEAAVAAQEFFANAEIPNNYQIQIPGGEYRETVRLLDAKLPDNPSGIRNTWAQQLLHEKMVDLQYADLNTNEE